jgi:hypothetical protein
MGSGRHTAVLPFDDERVVVILQWKSRVHEKTSVKANRDQKERGQQTWKVRIFV